MVEHLSSEQKVVGSSPIAVTYLLPTAGSLGEEVLLQVSNFPWLL